jgi:hypothetical protein
MSNQQTDAPTSNLKPQTSNISHADVGSIDAIIRASYDVISGPAGHQRDWDRERALFIPGARLIPTGAAPGSTRSSGMPQVLDLDAYMARVRPYFEKEGFYEKEIARRTERFGNIVHVFSTYESRHSPDEPQPFMRGINSIQLFYDGNRWWIVTVYWQHETAAFPIPEKYLTSGEG